MDKTYNHKEHEERIYEKWEKAGVFSPEKTQELRSDAGLENKDETFSVLMPPPNANAPLHCGHATYVIQDLMTRVRRMQGYRTCFFPGTDHAGFETQVVYERKLKKEGKSRFDFDRETLYGDILDFVKENSDVATNQLKRLGMSCDWSRNTFMLDDHVIETVYDTFEKMHEEGLVYKDDYMVNYSPTHGTTFSNLETTRVEQTAPLYYVKYRVKDGSESVTVATVRPETIPADVAIAVNPKDSRYEKLVGKIVLNPLNDREMVVIADDYVDIEFGTGALKITPGHDLNDYEIGKKHGLEMISLLDLYGKMNKNAGELEGMRVASARKRSVEILEEKGALEKIDEKYTNSLLVDYKDKKPIEPMLLPNWFVKMEGLSERAIEAIEKDEVKFNLPTWKNQILDWLKNIRDWPISRQTVFGIRIPIWYSVEKGNDLFVVFLDKDGNSHEGKLEELAAKHDLEDIKKGLQKVIAPKNAKYKISRTSPGKDFIQETDTFDTWFSSGQWPLTTLKYPGGKDFKDFYPTTFMDSMWDILFFWIARMIMFGLYLADDVPYKNVYIHGRIDDEKGQKMSKSKGNVVDPLEYVDQYGSDAVRLGVLVGGNTAAKTTSFGVNKVRGYRNFSNKIWNMARFMEIMVESYEKDSGKKVSFEVPEKNLKKSDKAILKVYEDLIKSVTENVDNHRFMDAGNDIYHFMWHTLADEYIEHVKTRDDKEVALSVLRSVYLGCLKLLHPFAPFVTEVIWEQIEKPEGESEILAVADWPKK
jgi:valyl-tRNA synthetase